MAKDRPGKMSEADARRFYRRAKASARSKGFHDDEHELAADVIVKFLENPNTSQTVDQAVGDAIREEFGDGRTEHKTEKGRRWNQQRLALMRVVSGVGNKKIGMAPTQELLDYQLLVDQLPRNQRVMVILLTLFGLNLYEIGFCFGVSSSRISQVLKNLREKFGKKTDHG